MLTSESIASYDFASVTKKCQIIIFFVSAKNAPFVSKRSLETDGSKNAAAANNANNYSICVLRMDSNNIIQSLSEKCGSSSLSTAYQVSIIYRIAL